MIVIGGGIAGISVARELCQRGQHVTLFEAEDRLAYHTSGRSAEQLILGYGPKAVRELTDITVEMLLTQQADLATPVAWPSTFMTVGTASELADGAYPGQTPLDAETVHRLLPELRRDRFDTGALDERSLRTDAPAMLDWLIQDSPGLEIRLGERVTAAHYDEGQWTVTTTQQTVRSPMVINAAGAWADTVASLAGVAPLGLTPLRRTAAIFELDAPIASDRPMMMKIDGYYYRYEDDRAILASPQDAVASPAEDAQPIAADIEALRGAISHDTTWWITGVRAAWTGLRTEARDGVPVVGADEHPGFFWLAGQSGYGFQTSLGFARLAADLILDGAAGSWVSQESVAALAPDRLR